MSVMSRRTTNSMPATLRNSMPAVSRTRSTPSSARWTTRLSASRLSNNACKNNRRTCHSRSRFMRTEKHFATTTPSRAEMRLTPVAFRTRSTPSSIR
ncbi:hypothetical protein HYPSUDRAFT_618177 [Hypholoma sublateritium FD-334 SS-4]|uniref:Uncharacterized protein n=1 Tax=Hypholoma sublateritium (strain FD-334 SS-4) TaxID=945553 RepID=A0A0D2LLF0_HYPSF|nr:hypothetical protein HYPSUDRAFT_618177 [Hypholoma sublateritium FD-334 SS-4]